MGKVKTIFDQNFHTLYSLRFMLTTKVADIVQKLTLPVFRPLNYHQVVKNAEVNTPTI